MKITMLGTSGSGKTVYMSAMSELFFNSGVENFRIRNRDLSYKSAAFVNLNFERINTLYQFGEFPPGTSDSVVMPLELTYKNNKILEIDWIDYRGGAIKEIALGDETPKNSEVFAALIASDIVMVFVDAAKLKICRNDITARSLVGANEISQLLSLVIQSKHIDVIFLLTKIDSSIINLKRDYNMLKGRVAKIYSRFLIETNTNISSYTIMPIGAVGYGNVITSYNWTENDGKKNLNINHKIVNFENMYTINIASSFAIALLRCLISETKRLNTKADKLAEELEYLRERFGPVRNLLDLLFNNSKTRRYKFELEDMILESRKEVRELYRYKDQLNKIISLKI